MATVAKITKNNKKNGFVAGSFLVVVSMLIYFIGGLIFGGAVDYHSIEYVGKLDDGATLHKI